MSKNIDATPSDPLTGWKTSSSKVSPCGFSIRRPDCGASIGSRAIAGTIDPPVVGSFENGVGHFFGKETLNGKPIIVVFRWDARNEYRPVWGQAFSPDNG